MEKYRAKGAFQVVILHYACWLNNTCFDTWNIAGRMSLRIDEYLHIQHSILHVTWYRFITRNIQATVIICLNNTQIFYRVHLRAAILSFTCGNYKIRLWQVPNIHNIGIWIILCLYLHEPFTRIMSFVNWPLSVLFCCLDIIAFFTSRTRSAENMSAYFEVVFELLVD